MSGKHTPGPWATDPEVDHEAVLAADGGMVADCAIFGPDVYHRPQGASAANARLIAAAPDMLTAGKHLAVKLAEAYRAVGADPAGCQAIRDWMAAVAKAKPPASSVQGGR